MMMKKFAVLCFAVLSCFVLLIPAPVSAELEQAPSYDEQSIDLDLAQFSGTVVYAQIYQMAIHPEDYLGKIIRLSGWYGVAVDGDTGAIYTVCFIPDATACCTQGMEFVWAGEHSLPESYPEPGTEIVVTGRFETYFEGEWEYMRLVDAELTWTRE